MGFNLGKELKRAGRRIKKNPLTVFGGPMGAQVEQGAKAINAGTVNPSQAGGVEEQLKQLELDNLLKNNELTAALMPFILEDMGITQTTDPETGKVSYARESSPQRDRLSQQGLDIQEAANVKTLAGLKGEIDIDPSVTKDIERGESKLREQLFRKLGPGAEGSDAWNRAIAEYERQSNALKYGIRHGEMTTADAIATNRQNQGFRSQNQNIGNLQSAPKGYGVSADLLRSSITPYRNERYRADDIRMRNRESRDRLIGSAISGGMKAGATMFGGGG